MRQKRLSPATCRACGWRCGPPWFARLTCATAGPGRRRARWQRIAAGRRSIRSGLPTCSDSFLVSVCWAASSRRTVCNWSCTTCNWSINSCWVASRPLVFSTSCSEACAVRACNWRVATTRSSSGAAAGIGAPQRDRADTEHDRRRRAAAPIENGCPLKRETGAIGTAAGIMPGGEFDHGTPSRA